MFVEEATDLHAWHFAKRFYLLRFEVVHAVHTVAVDYPLNSGLFLFESYYLNTVLRKSSGMYSS